MAKFLSFYDVECISPCLPIMVVDLRYALFITLDTCWLNLGYWSSSHLKQKYVMSTYY